MIKTRFAPSPTGYLHIGSLRTALYAYLLAKKKSGHFILRIEDTDRARFVDDGVANILKSLYWAGVVPDEGVVRGADGEPSEAGENGPYTQSLRLPIYKKYVDELIANDHAYYCFCSAERLDEVRKLQELNKQPTGYDGNCRNVTREEAEARIKAGEKFVVRMKMPRTGETKINDLIRGEVVFKNELIDDQVILKSDGFPTYHLAVVVDDHFMEITHIIRGEEWLSSTPKHVQLYKYFGWEIPAFAHLPLLLNTDGSKLSKRQGDVSVDDYRKKGYLPEALINFVAFLGWNPGGEKEMYSLAELIQDYSIEKTAKKGAVFNLEKLDWYNKQYIKLMSAESFALACWPYLAKAGLVPNEVDKKKLSEIIPALSLEKERVARLDEITTAVGYLISEPTDYPPEILVWKKSNRTDALKNLELIQGFLSEWKGEWKKEILETETKKWIADNGLTNGDILWPLRVALSGLEKSPGSFEIMAVLGSEKTLARLKKAITKLSA
ncbi:MAG TPA: glutamate--tRNA ligase [Candidatus Magasanikbacteria bacterium]|nr:glutamate--tRNA ligase [Candidatus Magasanikbacteria bacterium]